jgi:uncharacterized protein YdaU (DUF1376 family)
MSRPWMPLYVADYLADTGHLSTLEHGAYMLLIMHYWSKGSLPDDDKRLASIARALPEQWADMRATIAEFFEDGWKHSRIDAELENAAKAYERRAAAGRAGGKAKAEGKQSSSNAKAGLKQSYSHSPSSNDEIEPNGSISPEPEKSAPVAMELPCVSGEAFPIFEADVSEWSSAFPAVDTRQQLAAMRSWLNANPTRRKTKRGMRKFIVSWLDRRQNAGHQAEPRAASPPKKVTHANMWDEDAIAIGIFDDPSNQTDRSLDASLSGGQNQGHGYPRLVAGS